MAGALEQKIEANSDIHALNLTNLNILAKAMI